MSLGVRRARWVALAWGLAVLWAGSAHAQSAAFLRDCQSWIEKKGYSTDYVEQKTGRRQRGLAGSWRGNVPLQDVQPGDVVLIPLIAPGAAHAAIVEEVRKKADGSVSAIRVSESNWGRMTSPRCLVTENFGRVVADRWIDAGAVAHVWRPSLPLPE
jgi:hypothetical protein